MRENEKWQESKYQVKQALQHTRPKNCPIDRHLAQPDACRKGQQQVHNRRAGIDPNGIEVKIFGGGNVIGRARRGSDAEGIGDANISAVRAQLARADLLVTAESIGGRRGCKILFNTATGDVLRKYLRSMTTRA